MAKVRLKDHGDFNFSLTVDGQEIPGVTSYSLIRTGLKKSAVLLVSIESHDLEIDADAEVARK